MTSMTSVATSADSRSWAARRVAPSPIGGTAAESVVTLTVVTRHDDDADVGGPDPAGESSHGPANDGVIELLGLLAYASLVAFFRLADDASLASSLPDKADLAAMAAAQFGHFELLRARIDELGGDPEQAMRPFVEPIDAFHARTAPSTWLEGLVKAYVGDGIAADFYRVIAQLLDPPTRSLVLTVLADGGHAQFAITRVREAIAADPALAGRLALWARRLVGEALSQARRVAGAAWRDRKDVRRADGRPCAAHGRARIGRLGRVGQPLPKPIRRGSAWSSST